MAIKKGSVVKAMPVGLFVLYMLLLYTALGAVMQGCTGGDSSTASLSGKKMYLPTDEETVLDKSSGLKVISNIINIMVAPGTTPDAIEKIVSSVGGKIVGYDVPNNLYQIKVNVANLRALDAMALKLLGEHKPVESVSKCSVSVHEDPYYTR